MRILQRKASTTPNTVAQYQAAAAAQSNLTTEVVMDPSCPINRKVGEEPRRVPPHPPLFSGI